MWSYFENYQHFWKDELPTLSPTTPIDYSGPFEFADNPNRFQGHWHLAQAYYILFAIQTASLSARSLVLFQTSEYFGVLLRMMQRLIIEMSRFLVVLALILVGFVFGFYYIQGGYQVPFEGDVDVVQYAADWYTGFKYLFQLTVGVGDFSDIEDIVPDEITAQLFTILYIIFATILMMNLLIALMTTTFDNVYSQARTESSFAIAETTFDLSHRSRFMPAPICIHIMAIAIAIHIVNFFTSICFPKSLNIYNFIDHKRYKWLVETRLFWKQNVWCCGSNDNNDSNDINDEVKEEDTYKLITRGRVWKYYLSTIFFWEPECIQKKIKGYRFNIHHSGCYSCIPTKLGAKIRDAEKDRSTCNGITLNQYAEEYEKYHKFALDPQDTVLLKHLTVDTLFCKHCFRPFDPKHVENSLLTPFWALSEVLSILLFPFTVWLPLLLVYFMVMFFEWIGSCFDDDVDDAPQVLDHDRQFFSRDSLHLQQDKQR